MCERMCEGRAGACGGVRVCGVQWRRCVWCGGDDGVLHLEEQGRVELNDLGEQIEEDLQQR